MEQRLALTGQPGYACGDFLGVTGSDSTQYRSGTRSASLNTSPEDVSDRAYLELVSLRFLFVQTLQSNLKPHNGYGFASKDDSSECSLDSFWFLHIFFVNLVRKLVIVFILLNLISKNELCDETGDP